MQVAPKVTIFWIRCNFRLNTYGNKTIIMERLYFLHYINLLLKLTSPPSLTHSSFLSQPPPYTPRLQLHSNNDELLSWTPIRLVLIHSRRYKKISFLLLFYPKCKLSHGKQLLNQNPTKNDLTTYTHCLANSNLPPECP